VIAAQLPILQVVLPLLAAPVCVLLRRGRLTWVLTVAVTWTAFAIAFLLVQRVLAEGTISYAIGGWAPPWGIEYRVDVVNAFVLLIVAAVGAVVALAARASVEREIAADKHHLFYGAYLLFFTGLLGITITGDAFNIFVFLEISSLSSYVLIALGSDRRALTAAFQYLVLGTIGATFILIGIGLVYMMTGTLNLADMAVRVAAVSETRPILAAAGFLTAGIGLKLALFPLHLWLPNAYTYAPSVVSAFMAATATKVSVYVLLRFMFTVFGPVFAFDRLPLAQILLPLAALAMLVGSTVAIFQTDIKRMLAYSSVAQIGYIILGVALVNVTGLTGGIVHLFNHALMKGGLFLALACVAYRTGSTSIEAFRGLGRRMPLTMLAFVFGGLSVIGVPLTVGFISKWYLILGAIEKDWWPLAGLVLFSSLLAMVYIWRVIEAAYFQPLPDGADGATATAPPPTEAPLSLLIPTWMLIAANVYFGIDTDLTAGVARRAAMLLLGVDG